MPTRLTPSEANTVKACERRLSVAVARLREIREGGVAYQRTLTAIVSDLDEQAQRLETIVRAWEVRE